MNAEAFLIQNLNNAVDETPAFGEVPADRPRRFITVERTGGPPGRFIDAGTFAVQVWAPTRAVAAEIADKIADHLKEETPKLAEVAKVEVVSIYNFPDPDSRTPRYQLTVSMSLAVDVG